MKYKLVIWAMIFVCAIWGLAAIYGFIQLYTRSDRADLLETQKAEIANLKIKVAFLENNDWALIIQQFPQLFQDELEAWDEGIRQKKNREYERYEQPIITKMEIDG